MYFQFLWRIIQLLILLIVSYFVFKVARQCLRIFFQCYILWSIAVGGRGDRRSVNPSVRLHLYVVKPSLLDKITVSELYYFARDMLSSDVSIQTFHKVLNQYTFAALFRDKIDGSLRGMMLLGIDSEEVEGMKCTCVKVGLVLFKAAYHGGPLILMLMFYHLVKEMLFHPFTPLFMIGKSFSYKSYLIMTNNFKKSYPRYDLETPQWEKSIMDKFGRSFESMTDVYEPATGVISREKTKLKAHIAFISEEELSNPHIRYFQQLNPSWNKGHCLVVMSQITWWDAYTSMKKMISRATSGHKADTTKMKHDSRGIMEMSLEERRLSHMNTYESSLCEIDPWSKMAVHHVKKNFKNYIRTESVSQRRRSDSFTFN